MIIKVQPESSNQCFDTSFVESNGMDIPHDSTGFEEVHEVVTSDHSRLTNRDAANQHPISAITDLVGELSGKVNDDDALSNLQIQKILGW